MEQKLTLTPGELYYLGTILQAKYIDYAYVAAMDDISKNYSVYESEARSSLVNAGVLTEDFSGNLELDEKSKHLLRPIFFGEFEACVDITSVSDSTQVNTRRFHTFDGVTTMVCSTEDGKLSLEIIEQSDLEKLVAELLPVDYGCASSVDVESLPDQVTRIIAVKNTVIGKTSVVKLFVEADGILYGEKNQDMAQTLTDEMFICEVLGVLREVS